MTISVFLSKILNMSLTGSVAIGGVLLLRVGLRKSPKIFSYILWAGVLFRFLCPISIFPVQLAVLQGELPRIPTTETIAAVERLEEERGASPTLAANTDFVMLSRIPIAPEKSLEISPNLIFLLWISGTFGMLLYGTVSYCRLHSHLTGAVRLQGNVYLVDHMDSAFVAGFLSPKIYLPSNLAATQYRFILEHEQHHIQRLDHVVKFLSYIALSIHWFNPLAWFAFRLGGRDMEMSCDEAVIRKLGEGVRADYATALIQLATSHTVFTGTPLAFGEGDTKGRILNLARRPVMKKWATVTACLLCAVVLTACAVIPSRDVVSFSEETSSVSNIGGADDSNAITHYSNGKNHIVGKNITQLPSFEVSYPTIQEKALMDFLAPGKQREEVSLSWDLGTGALFFDNREYQSGKDFAVRSLLSSFGQYHPEDAEKPLDFMDQQKAVEYARDFVKVMNCNLEPNLQQYIAMTAQQLTDYQEAILNGRVPESSENRWLSLDATMEYGPEDDICFLFFSLTYNGLLVTDGMPMNPEEEIILHEPPMIVLTMTRSGVQSLESHRLIHVGKTTGEDTIIDADKIQEVFARDYSEQTKKEIPLLFLEYIPVNRDGVLTLTPYWCFSENEQEVDGFAIGRGTHLSAVTGENLQTYFERMLSMNS